MIEANALRKGTTFSQDNDIPKSIILLGDGQENTSPYVANVKQSLINNGIKVFSVGLGSGANKEQLRNLADETGGEFFYADNAFQLPGIFATIYGNLRNNSFLKILGGVLSFIAPSSADTNYNMLAPQQMDATLSSSFTDSILIDNTVAEATFLVMWDYSYLDFSLIDPDGIIIDPSNFSQYPDASYEEGVGYSFYRITNVLPGDWQINLNSNSIETINWELKVLGIDNQINFSSATFRSAL